MANSNDSKQYDIIKIIEGGSVSKLNSSTSEEDFQKVLTELIFKENTSSKNVVYNILTGNLLKQINDFLYLKGRIRITRGYDKKTNSFGVVYNAISENFILFEKFLKEKFVPTYCKTKDYILDIAGSTAWKGVNICAANIAFEIENEILTFSMKTIRDEPKEVCDQIHDILKRFNFTIYLTPAYISMTSAGTSTRIKITYKITAYCKVSKIDDINTLELTTGGDVDKLFKNTASKEEIILMCQKHSCIYNLKETLKSIDKNIIEETSSEVIDE